VRFAEHCRDRHRKDLIAFIVGDVEDPAAPSSALAVMMSDRATQSVCLRAPTKSSTAVRLRSINTPCALE
jgi:hypothetical protein